MNKKLLGLALLTIIGNAYADKALDIAFVDSFRTMRECEEGQVVGKELDTIREKISKEIQEEAQLLAREDSELKAKASTMKQDIVVKKERELAKKRRDLEDKVRDAEEELKITMQQKTEALATKIEEGITQVAKEKGVDAVIDKMTGRVIYTKDDNKGDITSDTIAYVNKKAKGTTKNTTTVAKKEDKKAAVAA